MTTLRTLAVLLNVAPVSLFADSFDGLYLPPDSSWLCDPQSIGMDGGPLAIENGSIYGVEGACQLTSARSKGIGTQFRAICSAEGDEDVRDIVITPVSSGLRIENYGWNTEWVRCGDTQSSPTSSEVIAKPANKVWNYSGQMGETWAFTEDDRGNSVTFTCNIDNNSAEVEIRLGAAGISSGPVIIDIDGRVLQMRTNAEDRMGVLDLECDGCYAKYLELWNSTASGNIMTVQSSDGKSAKFSLVGSGKALGDKPCLP
jgi:hypothetical protein